METKYSLEKLKQVVPQMSQQEIENAINQIEKEQKLYKSFDVYSMYVLLFKRAEAIKSGKKLLY